MKRLWIIAMIGVLALVTGCGGGAAQPTVRPLPSPAATDVPAPTTMALPTETPAPTSTPPPPPTVTPTSTDVPTPSAMPEPTATPEPTAVPTPSATPTPAAVLTPIGQIGAGRVGEEVTVEGAVVETASLSSGFKFTLDDGTGRIVLLMWHDVYDDCWDAPEVNIGARVRATGEIGEYEGELQIEPGFGGDVKAVEGAAAWATLREIGSLTGGDAGQRVMVEGRVIRVEGTQSTAKVFVGDDTGETLVLIWRNVLDRIPNNTALGVEGTRVRVVGVVEIYRSNLELVPALPYDVVVLETP